MGMNGNVDAFVEQSSFNFLGEKPFALHFVERQVLDLIALGFDDLDFGFNARCFESVLNMMRLP